MHRRRFLAAVLGACSSLLVTSATRHASAGSKIAAVQRTNSGTTFKLALEHAPFPHSSGGYSDPTVMVFVPSAYRAPDDDRLDAVVHFHGHNTTAQRAMTAHALREQLADSKQNAILVVPQGAVLAPESGVGKLATAGGLRRLLAEVADVLRSSEADEVLGRSAPPRRPRLGTVCLSAHSGGYTSVASCLRLGGVEVSEVYLFDALYGEMATYRDWVLAAKDETGRARHKVVSYYVGEQVKSNNLALLGALTARGVDCLHETTPGELSRAQMTRGRAIFLRSKLIHGRVPHELNGLRDCLFASCLRRRLPTDWFEQRADPRPLDVRAAASGACATRNRVAR